MYTSIFEESTRWRRERAKSYIFIFTAVSDFYVLLKINSTTTQTNFLLLSKIVVPYFLLAYSTLARLGNKVIIILYE